MEPDGMLNGWNRNVRITKAIKRAWITTRTVSPKPLSGFVPDVTLIAFPIPRCCARGGRTLSSRESLIASRQESGPMSDVESQSGHKPDSALFGLIQTCGVLDPCLQPRNQRAHQNLLIR